MNFNESLKRCRRLRQATQKQVAQAVGISETMYQFYEYGKSEPTVGVLIALAKYFRVSLDYLCGLSDEP